MLGFIGLVAQGSDSQILRFGVALALGSVTVLAVLQGRSQYDALQRNAYFSAFLGILLPGHLCDTSDVSLRSNALTAIFASS